MLRKWPAIILGLVFMLSFAPAGITQGAKEEPGDDMPESAPADVPAEFQDAAFNVYVDMRLLGQALNTADASLLCDVALQLQEGERVLLRPHKAVAADAVLKTALRLATDKHDSATLDRIAKAAKIGNNKELMILVEFAQKVARAPRKVDPALVVAVDQTTPEAFLIFKAMIEEVDKAKVLGDRQGLDQIERSLPLLTELHVKQREHLTKLINETRGGLPEKVDPAMDVLRKLAESSRGFQSPAQVARKAAERVQLLRDIAGAETRRARVRAEIRDLEARLSRTPPQKAAPLQAQLRGLRAEDLTLGARILAYRNRLKVL